MKVLSLFDGMSCAQIALNKIGIKPEIYFSSEIDKFAIKVTQANYPETVQLGDIRKIKASELPKIDLLIGGSPCQGFSFAGKQLNFQDPRSKLFFEFVRILKEVKPKYFLLENVKMKKEHEKVISEILGVDPIFINSALVSAQNRKRLYWSNIPGIKQPEDKKIFLKNIIENGVTEKDKSYCMDANYWKGGNLKSYFEKHRRQLIFQPVCTPERGRRLDPTGSKRDDKNGIVVRGYEVKPDGKTCALTTVLKDNYITQDYKIRKLTPVECERLQTVPDNYTNHVSNTQRYKMLGNGFTVDVIKHILSFCNFQ